MSKINTLLFDCDNTLVLSEDIAFEGCAELINEICQAKGVKLEKPFNGPTLMVEFVGQNFRGMISSLRDRYGFDLTPEELDGYVDRELDVIVAALNRDLKPCVGVDAQLEKLGVSGKYELAVVSSSAMPRVRASIVKVGQDKYFGDRVFSAASSLPKPTTKPDPAIYLHAMKVLGKSAAECVAIEDSRSGTLSASRAGIKIIGYTGPYEEERKPEMEKVLRDAGATVIMDDWKDFEPCLEKIENGSA